MKNYSFIFLRRNPFYFLVIVIFLSGASCSKNNRETESKQSASSHKDYFPDKVEIKYAKGFDVSYHGNYKVVRIFNPYKNTHDTLTYILTAKGTKRPSGFSNNQNIDIPISNFACIYTTHVAFTDVLGANSVIKGVASPEFIINPWVQKELKAGRILDIGQSDELNQETLIALKPEVLMVSAAATSNLNKYEMLMQSGISVVVNAEWLETTPLGRAGWFKLVAVLLNKEKLANEKFDEIEREYLRLCALTADIQKKPTIITGLSYKDAWYIPGGRSFMSHFIKDAGATYPWISDTTTASFPLNFETVYGKGLSADFWINPEHATTKESLLSEDKRYADFKPFKAGKIFANNKRLAANGSSEYWETGLVKPHVVLADLIKIFHPELLPDHELYYYKQVQ